MLNYQRVRGRCTRDTSKIVCTWIFWIFGVRVKPIQEYLIWHSRRVQETCPFYFFLRSNKWISSSKMGNSSDCRFIGLTQPGPLVEMEGGLSTPYTIRCLLTRFNPQSSHTWSHGGCSNLMMHCTPEYLYIYIFLLYIYIYIIYIIWSYYVMCWWSCDGVVYKNILSIFLNGG